jgi:hypothetical protein
MWARLAARCAKEKSIVSIFFANSMSAGDDAAAVLYEASRVNHSCIPNASYVWSEDLGMERLRAVKDIEAGEERPPATYSSVSLLTRIRKSQSRTAIISCGQTSASDSSRRCTTSPAPVPPASTDPTLIPSPRKAMTVAGSWLSLTR